MAFLSLNYVYVPTADADAAARQYVEAFRARLAWLVRGMGTAVACLRLAEDGPAVLLSGPSTTSTAASTPSQDAAV